MLAKVKNTNKYVVHFNNRGEVLRHYTMAPTPAKAKANAAYEFSKLLGVSVGLMMSRMKNHIDVVQLNGGTK
jgi:hypothetical protein